MLSQAVAPNQPTTNVEQRDPNETILTELEESHLAKQIKLPSQVPASAGGLNKTSKTTPKPPEFRYPLRSRDPSKTYGI